MRHTLLLLFFVLLLPGCPKKCQPKAARCQGTVVQICRPDGKWVKVTDCARVGAVPWACVQLDPQTCRCRKPVEKAKP
jgi:hypothetical protein